MGAFGVRAFRGQPRRIVRKVTSKKTKTERKEPPSPNELLMQRMKAAGVKPDHDHTEALHHE